MNKYAQKFREDDRLFPEPSYYQDFKYSKSFVRGGYDRDRDRILFSKAFRRLEHKAQVYTHSKGDHYRTRLTHTLEVMQISCSLARNLRVNEMLVEAISFGHDIGHTPFGHQGERTLNEIMSGKNDLGGKLKYKLNLGGFKHNFNSVKVLDSNEVKYYDKDGLNLCWQVIEGVLKHTSYNGKCNIENYICEDRFNQLHYNIESSVTIEGQIVALADEIAQRQHDLDDGLRNKGIGLSYDIVIEKLIHTLDCIENENFDRYVNRLKNEKYFINLKSRLDELKKMKIDGEDRKRVYCFNRLIREIIAFLVCDATIYSKYLIANLDTKLIEQTEKGVLIKTQVVKMSPISERINKVLKDMIDTKIINSYEVNRFDGKAVYIIKQLFKAYYTNPLQMPKDVLEKIERGIKRNIGQIKDIVEVKEFSNLFNSSNFDELDKAKVSDIIDILKLNIYYGSNIQLEYLEILNDENGFYSKEDKYLDSKKIKDMYSTMLGDCHSNEEKVLIVLIGNYYVFMEAICDYIAGMTDNYACSEYNNLYLV